MNQCVCAHRLCPVRSGLLNCDTGQDRITERIELTIHKSMGDHDAFDVEATLVYVDLSKFDLCFVCSDPFGKPVWGPARGVLVKGLCRVADQICPDFEKAGSITQRCPRLVTGKKSDGSSCARTFRYPKSQDQVAGLTQVETPFEIKGGNL